MAFFVPWFWETYVCGSVFFGDMTILDIRIDVSITVDNSTLGMIADTWPRLRVLTLGEPIKRLPPKITFNSLRRLAAVDDPNGLDPSNT